MCTSVNPNEIINEPIFRPMSQSTSDGITRRTSRSNLAFTGKCSIAKPAKSHETTTPKILCPNNIETSVGEREGKDIGDLKLNVR